MSVAYEAVIGLEIHVQLLTQSKAFCADSTAYGALPNTQVSPISLGHPGTLPRHNRQAVEHALKMGLALDCAITRENHYSRKNYFYADLPKGYQITQFNTPICEGGGVNIRLKDGSRKRIGLIRIHMEEDTGKSMHDQDPKDSLIDYNRAGTALIEVVTEPDIRSGEEAYAFVTEIRRLVRYLEICDGNMEEGSLRCDANVSIRPAGSTTFGTKVEVKNMNSISNVRRAIDHEIERQREILESGGTVAGETRGFNALSGTTFSMRSKEMVNDYRYFPEPDLPPLILSDQYIQAVHKLMPELPETLFQRFTQEFGLSEYDAGVLTDDKATAAYFLSVVQHTGNFKAAANWVTVHVKGYLNEHAISIDDFPLSGKRVADLIALIDSGKISNSSAAQKLFPAMISHEGKSPMELAETLNLLQTADSDLIETIVNEVLSAFPQKVTEYKQGKTGLLGMFVGEIMKRSKGKADPKKVNEVLLKKLEG
ncbi:MAG: glutamyl-tRNA amidotransferase [Bacteroidota bacterium]|jgi:aspartyl-tRNA(Asn)/glutamyl-tRNA(Gln) amidotransferase subunit B